MAAVEANRIKTAPFTSEAYDALLADRPETTLFHTRLWARIVTETFGELIDCSRIVRLADREFALPLFKWRRLGGLLATTHSSFPFLYGGPIPYDPDLIPLLLEWLSRERGSLVMIGNPFFAGVAAATGESPKALESVTALPPDTETTHLLQLPETPEIFWEKTLTSRKRNDIRRLRRKGVLVETSRAAADIEAFYRLYKKRMATWNRAPGLIYPIALYENMIDLGQEVVRLYIVRFEGKVIGGTMVCHYNGISHYLAGYFDHDASRLRPNVLVQDRIIQDAIREGNRIYDMLPSAGIESVVKFKESFGGRPVVCGRWERHDWLQRMRRRLKR